jgi:hypothetical protein
VLIVLKSGSLNFLETSGPVKACNGIALALTPNYPISESAKKMCKLKLSFYLKIKKNLNPILNLCYILQYRHLDVRQNLVRSTHGTVIQGDLKVSVHLIISLRCDKKLIEFEKSLQN